ncbi:extracellular solute-binding protein [Streptomyces hirsutus]|uniref:extracellular solute-binding protein n=1 Tax=Streptomyces hirsutus TaxID=35620 RepID=UPI00099E266E|nr:extracellular solute-binding protein [Streptomyces hirsutus]
MQRRSLARTIAAISALGLTGVLGGCGLGGGSSDITLELVAADYGTGVDDSSKKYWAALTEEYEAAHPGVRIDVTVHSWNDIDRKVKERVDAGDPPDMAQIGAYADYAADGLLYKADDLLSIPVQADFVAQLATAGQIGGIQYGMPFASSTRVLFYNKALFEDAGLTPPTTWAELAANAALHGCVPGRDFALFLACDDVRGVIRIEVSDTHPDPPAPTAAAADEEHGRGLALVDALATLWGVTGRIGPGKTVWAECATVADEPRFTRVPPGRDAASAPPRGCSSHAPAHNLVSVPDTDV